MNYELEIQKSNPDVFANLNGNRPPLVAGSGNSTYMSASSNIENKAWVSGLENQSFTQEVWYLPVSVTADTVVMGHSNEGVFFDGTKFTLKIKLAGGTIENTWIPDEIQSWLLTIVYDTKNFFLYVNGDLKITLTIPSGSVYSNSNANTVLNSGPGSGIYDSAAVFYRNLDGSEIRLHHLWGTSIMSSFNISAKKGADAYELTYSSVDVFQSFQFDETNWDRGYLVDVDITSSVRPDSTTGSWSMVVPIITESTTLSGIHVTAYGTQYTLEYSTDGTSWQMFNNKTTILQDQPITPVLIRVNLLTVDSRLSKLIIDVLEDRTIESSRTSRVITFKNAYFDQTPSSQIVYQYDSGATLNSGYLKVSSDTAPNATSVKAIEFWAKIDSASGSLIYFTDSNNVALSGGSLNVTGCTVYRNGELLANNTTNRKEMSHYLVILNTAANSEFIIGANSALTNNLGMNISSLAIYSRTFTAPEADALYRFNVGSPSYVANDNAITVTEPASPFDLYAYTWSIVSG